MRGSDVMQETPFATRSVGSFAPADHRLRAVLSEHDACRELFERVLKRARAKSSLSSEGFSVDGTLVRVRDLQNSFVPKDGAPPPSSGSMRRFNSSPVVI